MNMLYLSLLALFLSALPVVVWFFVFQRKKRTHFFWRFFLTFLLSALLGVFFWQQENSIGDWLLQHGIPLLIVFLILGTLVEYGKNMLVRIIGFRSFQCLDDVMDMSFVSALGFTFGENFFHFFLEFSNSVQGPVALVKFFIDRAFFILPIHLFCSGMFGYFYGVALFGSPTLQEKMMKGKVYTLFRIVFFFLSPRRVFQVFTIAKGTLLSVFFYASFFSIIQQDWTIGDILVFFDFERWSIDERLMPLIAFLFFKVGVILLFSLLDKKKRWEEDGLLEKHG